jgi:hypothetical protein
LGEIRVILSHGSKKGAIKNGKKWLRGRDILEPVSGLEHWSKRAAKTPI